MGASVQVIDAERKTTHEEIIVTALNNDSSAVSSATFDGATFVAGSLSGGHGGIALTTENDLTIAGDFTATALSGKQVIFDAGGINHGIVLYLVDSDLYFRWTNNGTIQGPAAYSLAGRAGEKVRYAVSISGQQMSLYVDGALVGTHTHATSFSFAGTGFGGWGAMNDDGRLHDEVVNSTSYYLTGSITEAYTFDGALSFNDAITLTTAPELLGIEDQYVSDGDNLVFEWCDTCNPPLPESDQIVGLGDYTESGPVYTLRSAQSVGITVYSGARLDRRELKTVSFDTRDLSNSFFSTHGTPQTLDTFTYNSGNYATNEETGLYNTTGSIIFEASGNGYAEYTGQIPNSYEHRPLDVILEWVTDYTGNGTVQFSAAIDNYGETLNTGVYDYGTELDAVFDTTGSGVVYRTPIFLTPESMQQINKGDYYNFRITRNTDSSQDTVESNVYVLSVDLRESGDI